MTSIVAYSKGFACACGPGIVYLYEKTDDKDFFKKAREIRVRIIWQSRFIVLLGFSTLCDSKYVFVFYSQIPQDANSADPSKAETQSMRSLAVSPSEETLVASTEKMSSMELSSKAVNMIQEISIENCPA